MFEQLWPLFAKTLAERVHEPDAVLVCSRVIRYGARALPPHQMARVAPAIFEHITECFGQSPSGELLHVVGSLVGSLVGISMLEPVAPVLTKAFGVRLLNYLKKKKMIYFFVFLLLLSIVYGKCRNCEWIP